MNGKMFVLKVDFMTVIFQYSLQRRLSTNEPTNSCKEFVNINYDVLVRSRSPSSTSRVLDYVTILYLLQLTCWNEEKWSQFFFFKKLIRLTRRLFPFDVE